MAVKLDNARDYVYRHGTLFERALFAWLFDSGSLDRLRQVMLCYKNPDGGFGHGFEHDLKAPQSNPLALEYLLGVMKHCAIPAGDLLDGCALWVESQMDAAGSLPNAAAIRAYPLAPWWQDWGGQTQPDSIVGNLIHFGAARPSLVERTKAWVLANITPEKILANDWLFMAYHYFDFFFAIDDLPDLASCRQATIDNIASLALAAPDEQLATVFTFAPRPDSMIAKALPPDFIKRCLDTLEAAQQDDGHWLDQHSLPQWYPATTINTLLALRRYGRWQAAA